MSRAIALVMSLVTVALREVSVFADGYEGHSHATIWHLTRSGITGSTFIGDSSGSSFNSKFPEFTESSIANVTVFQGREATLTCSVKDLGNYRVAWLRAEPDIGTLLSVHTTVIANDARLKVSHNGHHKWTLHIKDVAESDTGSYMCQINTEPMMSQTGYLDVLVPPTIIEEETSSDTVVDERGKVSLHCKARGYPTPSVTWRREDGRELNLGSYGGKKTSGAKYEGEFLNISQVSRDDMGAYLCIIGNSVPPSVSKRISLQVNFKPKIRVATQVVGAPVGSEATLECRIESSPKPLISWMRTSDQMILLSNSKYQLSEEVTGGYKIRSRIRIGNITERDFGSYKCVAKNTLGEKEGLLRLFETKVEKSRENTEASTIKSTLHGSPGSSLHTVDRNSNGYNNEDKNNDRSSNKRFKNPHYYSESSDYNFDHSSNYNHNNYTLFVSNNMNNNNNDNSNNNNLHRIHINHRRNTGHSSLLNLNLSFYYLTTCNLIYLIVYLSSSIPLHF